MEESVFVNREYSKKEFLIEYVLNRANTATSLDGNFAAQEAIKAWKTISKEFNTN